jgi:hypothetical protein
MRMHQAMWHGSTDEYSELLGAIGRHCTCSLGPTGQPSAICAAHHMLGADQRALDGLLFARRMRSRLKCEEWAASTVTGRRAQSGRS